MKYPDFYNEVQPLRLYDALSDFLGAAEDGEVEMTYLDCVKLAGHSCPTVAGAYLMALKGLAVLYPQGLPERGNLHVAMKEDEKEGVTGVIANVISFIVGASGVGGFKGIQGNFSRNNLVAFNKPMQGEVTLTRLDTNQSVSLSYNPSMVPGDKNMMPLMGKCLGKTASQEEQKLFGKLWQERVSKILLTKELWDQMITIH
ncbi:MAG: FmdE family protein [Sulfurovum sp.]|nr:FmdE family protein [Sulfurovum sp.]MDD3602713.1 FmdE family protein [Sulfurovum sp.]